MNALLERTRKEVKRRQQVYIVSVVLHTVCHHLPRRYISFLYFNLVVIHVISIIVL